MAEISNPFKIDFTTSPSPVPAQRTAYNEFNKQYTDFLAGQETVPQLTSRYENQFNVPFLRDQSQKQGLQLEDLQNRISSIPLDINSETSNSLLTAGQKARQVESRQAPLQMATAKIAPAFARTQEALGMAQTNVTNRIGEEQAQQLKMQQPWLQAYDANTIMNAAEMTGWTFANSQELQKLITNASNGLQWSNAEANRAHELAVIEKQFQNSLKLNEQQASLTRAANKDIKSSDVLSAYMKYYSG